MKRALVAVKRVVDYNARVRVNPDKVGHRRPADRRPCRRCAPDVARCAGHYRAARPKPAHHPHPHACADGRRPGKREDEHEPFLRDRARGARRPAAFGPACLRGGEGGEPRGPERSLQLQHTGAPTGGATACRPSVAAMAAARAASGRNLPAAVRDSIRRAACGLPPTTACPRPLGTAALLTGGAAAEREEAGQ